MARGGRRTARNLMVNPPDIHRKIERARNKNNLELDINGQLLKKGVPIHFGGMSDPFSNSLATAKSLELLNTLKDHNVPTIISTKNTSTLIEDKTLRILAKMKHVYIQVSFSTPNADLAASIEPNAPSPKERLSAISKLSATGFQIAIRLQPLFPSLIEENLNELIPAAAEAGVKHVIIEFLKVPVEKNISEMEKVYDSKGWKDYEIFERPDARLLGREWILPAQYKWEKLQPIIMEIRKHGMTYGAGDYGLNHLGDTGCCCGVDKLDGFSNWFQGNLANLLRESPLGYVTVDMIDKYWYPNKSIRRVLNSNSRIDNKNTIKEYLIAKWNKPGTVNAPNEFLGVTWKGDYDDSQNCVYIKGKI